MLIDGLKSHDAAARKAATQLVASIGFTSNEKPPALIEAVHQAWLDEPDEHLRVDMGLAMSRFQTPLVHDAVRRGLSSDRSEILGDSAAFVDWSGMKAAEFPAVYDRLVAAAHAQNLSLEDQRAGPLISRPKLGDPRSSCSWSDSGLGN